MKAKICSLFAVLGLLTGSSEVTAQNARFFRITVPTATTITTFSFNPDGTLVWSNALPGATYTVQTVVSSTYRETSSNDASNARVANRSSFYPSVALFVDTGFRCACGL